MATISKFYLRDATSPNTGTMPSTSPAAFAGTQLGLSVTGNAAAASTARDATDTAGAANPDTESTITSNADTTNQLWGHRRFVSRPLAATTFTDVGGTWTFSYARQESNLLHNQTVNLFAYAWRPSSGAIIGTGFLNIAGNEPTVAATEQAEAPSVVGWNVADVTIIDGDILVFEISTNFTQGMATAYTEGFAYDGTTEASTTTCASFVTPPAALTLFTPAAFVARPPIIDNIAVTQASNSW